ncbi:MAG: hypothetical protein JWN88_2797 [Frankiales bacterium]|nr:hypothetical protein [Frankiales bacterium]
MRTGALALLRCPRSGQVLHVELRECDGDDVELAVLTSEAGSWPVLGGIAVLTEAGEAVVPMARSETVHLAMAEVAFGDRPRTRTQALVRRAGAVGGQSLLAGAATRWRGRARAEDAELFRSDDPLRVLERSLLRARSPMPEAHAYFSYRFSLPRHLVALQLMQVFAAADAPVLDLGCGAGHMTFSLSCLRPGSPVVGIDMSFAHLWVARRVTAQGADYVCGDVRALPFAGGTFADVLSVDVLSFVREKWSAVREAKRVLRPGGSLAITSVKDADRAHVYAGLPLSAAGWADLLRSQFGSVRVLDDDVLLERYLAGRGLPERDEAPGSPTISLLCGGREAVPVDPDLPLHAVGPLGINPLYRVEAVTSEALVLRRALPAGSFADDNPRLLDYLPEMVILPRWLALAAARGERPVELLPLVRDLVLLALPPRYVEDSWPEVHGSSVGHAVAW